MSNEPRHAMTRPKARLAITVLTILLAMAACLGLAACSVGDGASGAGGDDQARSGEEKVLNAGSTTYFYAESMDPASEWDSWYLSYYGIMENLFKVSDDLTPEPWLAEDAASDDGRAWTVTIKEGITFTNGEPVDAAAVKVAWERTYAENPRAKETLAIESMEADGQTLTVTTEKEVPDFRNALCDPLLCVYYVGDDVDYAEDTPGTGPYVKEEFVPEDHITMVPNERYWNGAPKLDRVSLYSFTDDNNLTMAMQNGEIDAVAMPSASTRSILSGDGFQVFTRTTSRADFIRMNMESPMMGNLAIRTAVAFCIDRDGYSDVICQGSAVPSWGVYSDTLPFGGTEGLTLDVSEFSVDKAKAVLDEAGITDGDGDGVRELDGDPVRIDLYTCTSYERFVLLADDLQSKLAQAGIELEVVPVDYFIEDAETFDRDDPDMCLNSNAMAPTGNQAYFASQQFATDGSSNLGHYSNATVDELVARLEGTMGFDERNELARQIAQQVLDDQSFVFFANPEACVIARDGVSGLDASPSEYYFVTVDTDVE